MNDEAAHHEEVSGNGGQPTLPILPIRNAVLFPRLLMPLHVGVPRSVAAIESALSDEASLVGVFAMRPGALLDYASSDLYTVGTRAAIHRISRNHGINVALQGLERIRLAEVAHEEPFVRARVVPFPLAEGDGSDLEALEIEVWELAARIVSAVHQDTVDVATLSGQFADVSQLAWFMQSVINAAVDKQQELLELPTLAEVLRRTHDDLTHELKVLEVRQHIAAEAQQEMTKETREHILRQQMRAIMDELGESDPEQAELNMLRKRLEEADLPEAARDDATRELGRLTHLPKAAPDYQITRSYLDFVVELPWHRMTEDSLDLARAREILDEDHYDLVEVKERIVEHLAVMKLNAEARSPILCFVGPPGTGKTSLGQSIARALGRKFEHFSLGGVHDEAELRGHRRTYIGAMPGRVMQALRRSGVRNPLIMLDEVDKLGRDFRGDPAAALMEILDPAQNFAFHDNYLDLPFDLSRVFFITTANTLEAIPQPLLDRMETLRLAGYSEEEKQAIAHRYLIPRGLKESGLTCEQVALGEGTLGAVINRYTREAGVRQLERALGRLLRKVAVRVAEGKDNSVTILPGDLVDMLGVEQHFPEQARHALAPGVATGLAWSETGGEVLYVEALLLPGRDEMILTGQLGDVLKESAVAALSYVRSRATLLDVAPDRLRDTGVHVHIPAGATPKDGPSAGVAIATALASAFTGLSASADTAMTGEITLSGLVLPIGGVKEKVLAARRAGLRRVLLPRHNMQHLHEVPDHVREEMTFVPVDTLQDVLHEAIPGLQHRFLARA